MRDEDIGTDALVVTTTRRGSLVELALAGDLDISTEAELRAAVTAALQMTPSPLVVDLDDAMFCGARGLAVLVEATAEAATLGVELVLAHCPRSLLRLVELLGLQDAVRIALAPTGGYGVASHPPAVAGGPSMT